MSAKTDENDAIHLLRDAVIAVIDMADDADSDQVKLAMDILLAGTSQLGTIFQRRCAQLANQKQPRAAKPPKPTPQKTAQTQKPKPSSNDTQNSKNDSEDRSKAVSSIQQGIRQADASLDDQQKQLRNFTYGQNDDERSFRLAAKAIAS
jgi:pyruvate/2-oxoglutarate dehydrogenase complex dihydrolipoamide acyltransferase (E2) component